MGEDDLVLVAACCYVIGMEFSALRCIQVHRAQGTVREFDVIHVAENNRVSRAGDGEIMVFGRRQGLSSMSQDSLDNSSICQTNQDNQKEAVHKAMSAHTR